MSVITGKFSFYPTFCPPGGGRCRAVITSHDVNLSPGVAMFWKTRSSPDSFVISLVPCALVLLGPFGLRLSCPLSAPNMVELSQLLDYGLSWLEPKFVKHLPRLPLVCHTAFSQLFASPRDYSEEAGSRYAMMSQGMAPHSLLTRLNLIDPPRVPAGTQSEAIPSLPFPPTPLRC